MREFGLWRKLTIWLLRHLNKIGITLAQWSDAQLSAHTPQANLAPSNEETRQAGEPPAHWLNKVQAASQPPEHWLEYIQSKTGQMPVMQDLTAIAEEMGEVEASPKANSLKESPQLSPSERRAKLDTVRSTVEELPKPRSSSAANYQSPKQAIPAHLQWRIQRPAKVRYEAPMPEKTTSRKVSNYQNRYDSPKQAAYHASLSYAMQKAMQVNLPRYAAKPSKNRVWRLRYPKQQAVRGSVSQYAARQAHQAVNSPADYQKITSENAENMLEYPKAQENKPMNDSRYTATTPREEMSLQTTYQAGQKAEISQTAYAPIEKSDLGQSEYRPMQEKARLGESSYPQPQDSSDSQVSYPAPSQVNQAEASYRQAQESSKAEPVYQSAQESRETDAQYQSKPRAKQSMAQFAEIAKSSNNTSQYRQDSSVDDAYQAINSASTDFWIPLPSERQTVASDKTPVERPSRLDAEQRGEF